VSLALTIDGAEDRLRAGSVEWADFDPTATSNAISLLGEMPAMPRDALAWTFAEYMRGFRRRRRNEIDWNNYTRTRCGSSARSVHLGDRDGANELADFPAERPPAARRGTSGRRSRGATRGARATSATSRTRGSAPSTSCPFRTMLAYERVEDDALVVAAGVPAAWLDDGEVAVRSLRTYWGTLGYTLRRLPDGAIALSLRGDVAPPGGIVLRPPLPGTARRRRGRRSRPCVRRRRRHAPRVPGGRRVPLLARQRHQTDASP
jgi:hypothetical protein